ncbi:DNA topoisomerase IB [Luteimonas sp. M1R5S18]|uniref:DNA topoisomerase n=1 Tax=Luteimonas rhizosphaericola TaxID=3042024 RepID=A0ABT6JLT3_9GAMM|nr:DNA topoisomerase IB [Luteimonas rhizosphaericola]MDH5830976.1 DNA topoisomerase IB [Luteimonas rhizosphaericola]
MPASRSIPSARARRRQALTPAERDAIEAGLRYVSDTAPGISRERRGRGFCYRDPQGQAVRDADTLQRIRTLAIPPAYRQVWICSSPIGHLQATGRDARGRKQYRYHPDWRPLRDANKFDRIVEFGRALPKLRRRVRADLAQPGLPREKVLAGVVAIMASTLVRVGNEGYARDNGSFGLTTLRNRHAKFLKGALRLQFVGKGGRAHEAGIQDRRLLQLVRQMHELPGQRLFQYRDDDGTLVPVDSADVNDYLREAMGASFTAKDFRTWGATEAAFRQLAGTVVEEGERITVVGVRKQVVEAVASMLGNTPTVCRKSYVDPRVFDGWEDGRLQRAAKHVRGPRQWEGALLRFLARASRTRKGAA